MLTFIETQLFTRLIGDYMSDEEYLGRGETIPAGVLKKIKEEIDG